MNIYQPLLAIVLSLVTTLCKAQKTDTIRVWQTDTLIFKQEIVPLVRCYAVIPFSIVRQPELRTYYELKDPQNGVYYYIYNEKNQLTSEGIYSVRDFTFNNKTETYGAFYDSKTYYYKKKGYLGSIHVQEDGRNTKTELFDQKKRLTKIIYYSKKTSETEKVEIYKKGRLKETRIYTSFRSYHTIKSNE